MKETILKYLEITAKTAGFGEPKNPIEIIGSLVGLFLSFIGIIFLSLIIYGGFLWMVSGGNENKILKAKKTLTNSIVGLIIVMSSYAITFFVINSLTNTIN